MSFSVLLILGIVAGLGTLGVAIVAVNQLIRLRDEIGRLNQKSEQFEQEFRHNGQRDRSESLQQLNLFNESIIKRVGESAEMQQKQLDSFGKLLSNLTQTNDKRLQDLQTTVQTQLKDLQSDNAKKLDQMRQTVDEKLHATLEKRLGESFKQVSDRLEQVHKGLGEMQTLAIGVGDLKKVLTNVKTRGTWGEMQLGTLLEQILTPDQYEANVQTKPRSAERVDFAIKLPGKGDDHEKVVWIPIDAKFPIESYHRLLTAQEQLDTTIIESATKELEMAIKKEARRINDKYVNPPDTTDYAILFLPVEGLFAEVIRQPGLCEQIQQKYRVNIAGPTTFAAFINSLQMGFRTLAIEKRSSEVWKTLSVVKDEFSKFGGMLEKTKKKLQEAGNVIDQASSKSRNIERKLRQVESLPGPEVEGAESLVEPVMSTENAPLFDD